MPEELLDITDFLVVGECGICPECGAKLIGHSLNGGTVEPVFNRTEILACPACGVQIARAPIDWELTRCESDLPPVHYWPGFKEILKKYWPCIAGGIGITTIAILLLRKRRGE